MRIFRSALALIGGLLFAASVCVQAQSVDAFVGLNALTASQAVHNIPRLGGGLFPSAGADLFLGPIGVGGEVTWRAGRKDFDGQQLRPLYYDFNLLFAPIHIARSITPELMLGVGGQSLRVYTGVTQCSSLGGCSDYASSNHLTGHVGLAVKVYLTQHLFLRPEAHFYFIRHNVEFQTADSQRFGISLGYTFGGS